MTSSLTVKRITGGLLLQFFKLQEFIFKSFSATGVLFPANITPHGIALLPALRVQSTYTQGLSSFESGLCFNQNLVHDKKIFITAYQCNTPSKGVVIYL